MCGRICLSLSFRGVQCICEKQSSISPIDARDKKSFSPEWRAEYNLGRKYEPSYNIAPTDIALVLVSNSFFEEDDFEPNNGKVLVPMMWGMIPFWHKGDYRKHGFSTNNCRLENMLDSKLFKIPFKKGQRCVLLCEGFYEWQTTKSAKSSERDAYFFHMPQKDEIKIYDKTTWDQNGPNLLKLAGLFDIWVDNMGDKIFSFSVITLPSNKTMSWLHYRMPAILETEDQINNWLNYKTVTEKQALECLRPSQNLKYYRVSKLVNNSRNNLDGCYKPFDEVKIEKGACVPKSKIMQSWLIVRKRERDDYEKEEDPKKKENIKLIKSESPDKSINDIKKAKLN